MERFSCWFICLVAGLLLVASVVLFFALYLQYVRGKYRHIPSPKMASFWLGHFPEIERERTKGLGENPTDELFLKWASEVGHLYVLHFLWMPVIIALDPNDVETVHMTPLHQKVKLITDNSGYLFGERFLGRGLFTIRDYDTWKPRRKLYDPAFNRGYLKSLVPMFVECVDKFLDQLRPLADGRTQVPMKKFLNKAATDVISKVAFASDFSDVVRSKLAGLRNIAVAEGRVESLIEYVFFGVQKSLNNPLFKYFHPREAEGYREAIRALREIGKECILERIKALDSGGEVPSDILTCILKVASTDETADIETLVDDFLTFYVAGQETTANTMSFAVILIHQHPEVLERLLAEIDEVLGNKTTVSAEDLEKLKYTEQVIEETLRTHCPVRGPFKESPVGGVTLSGYNIPGGTMIFTLVAPMCQMPQHFDDPNTFNPSRFDPENKRPSPFVYFPFGVGHRACIGRHFAMVIDVLNCLEL